MSRQTTPAIIVVSLPTAMERRRQAASRLQALGLEFECFDAFDGRDGSRLSSLYCCRPDLILTYDFRRRPVSGPELACMLSHMGAIRTAWLRHAGPVLVLEDDVVFCTADANLVWDCLSRAPDDAAYLQLALLPARTVEALAESYGQGGDLFVAKSGNFRIVTERGEMGCHCAAAYFVTRSAMQAIVERGFEGDRVRLPCAAEQIATNAALLADRFVFDAATRGGAGRGYVCAAPLATTAGEDSFLHVDHLPGHAEARDAALMWSGRLAQRLASRLRSDTRPPRLANPSVS